MCLKLEAVKLELELGPFIFVSSVLFSICGEAMSPSGARNMVALTPGGCVWPLFYHLKMPCLLRAKWVMPNDWYRTCPHWRKAGSLTPNA